MLSKNPMIIIWPLKPNRQELARCGVTTQMEAGRHTNEPKTEQRSSISRVGFDCGFPIGRNLRVSPSRAAGLNSIEVACGGISIYEYPALALVKKKKALRLALRNVCKEKEKELDNNEQRNGKQRCGCHSSSR
jgi:hypothetical protein